MNKIIRFIQSYLVLGLPLVIIRMVLETVHPAMQIEDSTFSVTKALWNILDWNIMLWFFSLVLFLISMVIIPNMREKALRRLANLKERDEREEYITGKASRAAYISTLSLMIFFLFFSLISINISKVQKPNIANHRYTMHLGLGFSFFNQQEIVKNHDEEVIFDSKDMSLSSSVIIFMLLSWQLIVFNFISRRELTKDIL
ncbi:hypothetical protein AYO45_01705 [Gammaproteobacteria bacterium SCGC AG-212-F23]|nr:hypothetical protein AYO45_01705 [Gammaproteobacteria bacterium SCGC AG-212-F23]